MRLAIALLLLSSMPALADELVEYPERAVLGILAMDIVPGLEDVLGLNTHRGVYVVRGRANSGPQSGGPLSSSEGAPAEGEIFDGDVIVAIDNAPVGDSGELTRILRAKKPWQTVSVVVLRANEHRAIKVRLESAPPLIYLPANTCPSPTVGAVAGLEFVGMLFFGVPLIALSPSDLAGSCVNMKSPCSPLTLLRQTERRTLIDINDVTFEIRGDWRRHTHLSLDACLAEQAALAQGNTSPEAAQ